MRHMTSNVNEMYDADRRSNYCQFFLLPTHTYAPAPPGMHSRSPRTTIRAAPGARPVLSGGQPLRTDWQLAAVPSGAQGVLSPGR